MSTAESPAESIFFAALAKGSAEDRAAYLGQACGADAELRRRVERLLQAQPKVGDFLQPVAAAPTCDQPLSEIAGTLVGGKYKLLEELGEGGMGTVWMAQQQEPVKRLVAVKLIKSGLDSRQVIARFEAERQALALMDHPNIAKVLDAGTVGGVRDEGRGASEAEPASSAPRPSSLAPTFGRPYFVMELVKGVPITKYCDEHRLTPRQRLELFVPVCQAVQHAHQKGIIHRDLKPSNILVAMYDGKPVPKVIDFGVAKATGQQLTEHTLVTGFGNVVGTLEYMSPEQAELNQLDIDTRSDIYSLGVVLYELLTGTTPLDRKRLKQAAFVEMLRIIREEEPPKPSTRLSELGNGTSRRREFIPLGGEAERNKFRSTTTSLASVAAVRQTEPAKLTKLLRGELDWIVMKALEKDRNRRYETANGFAMDVQRYLADEPVHACPPSVGYRFRKFVRRNKEPVLAASLVLLVLVGGIIGTTWGMHRATEARAATEDEAKHKEAALSAALLEKQRANEQAAIAKSVTMYLERMLGSFTTASGKGPDYTVLQLFNDYAADLDKQPPDHPEVEAALRATIGKGYGVLEQRDKAKKHLARALELRRSIFGDEHEMYADILVAYARPATHSDPAELPACEADLRRALAIYRARGVGGQPVIRALWTLRWNLVGQAYAGAPDKWDELEPVVQEALAEARKFPDAELPELAGIYQSWAGAKIAQGRYAEAEAVAREAVAMTRKLHPDHPEVIWGHFVLAKALRMQNKFREALVEDKRVLTVLHKFAPLGTRRLALALAAVIDTLDAADKSHALTDLFPSAAELDELESVFRQVLTTSTASSLDHEDAGLVAARGLIRFSEFYWRLGKRVEARKSYDRALEWMDKNQLKTEHLRRLRPDAVEQLGIEEKKKSRVKEQELEKKPK